MIFAGKFTEGPFNGLPLNVVPTSYLDFVNRTRPLPWDETVQIDSELRKRKDRYPVCPVCGNYSARNNFSLGANRKGRR